MRHHKLTWIFVIKILLSTYTITAISWPPPLILQLFHTSHFKQGHTFFLQPACFWVDLFCWPMPRQPRNILTTKNFPIYGMLLSLVIWLKSTSINQSWPSQCHSILCVRQCIWWLKFTLCILPHMHSVHYASNSSWSPPIVPHKVWLYTTLLWVCKMQ